VTAKTCPACSKPLEDGATRCANCGLALGEHQRCTQCHAIADVEPSAELRFVCGVCGGVRIPIDDPAVKRSAEQLDLLQRANVARSARAVWRVIAGAGVGFGAFSVLVLSIVIDVAHPIFVASAVAALAAAAPFLFAAFSWKRSLERGAELGPLLEKAWTAAAADIARARGGRLDGASLAKITRISEASADQVLSRMSAASLLTSSVTAEGGLQYTLVEAHQEDSAAP
jgi:hypothetical protein